jgi:hypothetical protein
MRARHSKNNRKKWVIFASFIRYRLHRWQFFLIRARRVHDFLDPDPNDKNLLGPDPTR